MNCSSANILIISFFFFPLRLSTPMISLHNFSRVTFWNRNRASQQVGNAPTCNYTPPGVIRNICILKKNKEKEEIVIKLHRVVEHGLRDVWKEQHPMIRFLHLMSSGGIPLEEKESVSILTAWVLNYHTFFLNQLLLGHRAQIGQGTYVCGESFDEGKRGGWNEKSNSFVSVEKSVRQ